MVVIPATQEVEVGGSWFEASPGKFTKRSYPKNKFKNKRTRGVA
jgi:hypothetical protein